MSRPPLSFWQLFWLAWLLCLVSSRLSADWPIDDDIHAHRLYAEARYSEAAEIFTDPAWKGHNAELMRSLLAQDDSEEQRSGTQSRDNEIDRLEQEDESESPRDGGGEGQDSDEESSAAEEPDSARDTTPSAQGNDQQALEDNEQTDDTDSNTTDVADRPNPASTSATVCSSTSKPMALSKNSMSTTCQPTLTCCASLLVRASR